MLPLLTLLACSSTTPEAPPADRADAAPQVTIVVSSRMDGEIEPCG